MNPTSPGDDFDGPWFCQVVRLTTLFLKESQTGGGTPRSKLRGIPVKLRAAHPALKGGVYFGAARPVFRISEIVESLLPRFL